ncbi:MAG: GAF domain-containing protein, partial [Anaerolineae bacterium]
ENARLFQAAELRAAELETLRQVGLKMTATLELNAVLDAILKGTFQILTGVQDAHIFLYQDGRLTFGAALWADGRTGQPVAEPRSDGLTYTVARQGQPIIVSDMRTHPLFAGAPHQWMGAIIGLPLKIGERVVGAMNVAFPHPRTFPESELHLMRMLADKAAIAIENARLHRAEHRRAEESTALLDIAQAVTSTLSLTQLLKQIAIRTAQSCQANRCNIFLLDSTGERLEPLMSQFADGHPDLELWHRWRTTTADRLDTAPLFRQVLQQRRPVVLEDVTQTDMLPRKWTEPFGVKKALVVPLVSRDLAIGVMTLDHEDPARSFSQEQTDLAVTIAGQVAVSIENAQLFEAERIARQSAETLQEVAAVLGSTLELEALLDRVLEEMEKVVPYASASVQSLHDGQLEIIAGRGFSDPEQVIGLAFPLSGDPSTSSGHRNPNRTVIAEKKPLVVPDAHAAYTAFQEEPHSHIRSWLGVPLLAKGRAIGMIALDRTEVDAFSQEEASIALAFANHAAMAMENARLYQATHHQAITDGLTRLYNSRYFYQELERELERSQRYGRSCSLIMLDLDDFKKYNDRYGHQAGDDLLRELAGLMRGVIRQTDVAARYGGEEFAVILPETDSSQAQALAERLRDVIGGHEFVVRDTQRIGRITVSQGVATYPDDARDVDGLVEAADMALLCAKEKKGQVCVSATIQTEESAHSHGAPM